MNCRKCSRKNNGAVDFMSARKKGKLTLTCRMCRQEVINANKKRRSPSMKEIISELLRMTEDHEYIGNPRIVEFAKSKYNTISVV